MIIYFICIGIRCTIDKNVAMNYCLKNYRMYKIGVHIFFFNIKNRKCAITKKPLLIKEVAFCEWSFIYFAIKGNIVLAPASLIIVT